MKKLFTIVLLWIAILGFSQGKPVEFKYPVKFSGTTEKPIDSLYGFTDDGVMGWIKKSDFLDGIGSQITLTTVGNNGASTLLDNVLNIRRYDLYADSKVQNSMVASTTLAPSVTAVNNALQFVSINEGVQGWGTRYRSDNPNNYGNIGAYAIDLSYNSSPSTDTGALGSTSFAVGEGTKAVGNQSFSGGSISTANGSRSFSYGRSTQANGSHSVAMSITSLANAAYSVAIGSELTSNVQSCAVFGTNNLPLSPTVVNNETNRTLPIFIVGNGTDTSNKSNALVVLKNGLATLPGVTNSLIQAESTGKGVVTREYMESMVSRYVPLAGVNPLNQITGPLLFNNASRIEDVGGNLEIHRNTGAIKLTTNVNVNADLELEPTPSSVEPPALIISSPNGTRWKVAVSDAGTLTVTSL